MRLRFPLQFPLPLVAWGALAWTTALAGETTSGALRYQFTPPQTNAYRVTLETTSQDQPVTLDGVVFVLVRAFEDGVATIGFRGALNPQPARGTSFGPPSRPGLAGEWWPRPLHLQPNLELRVDTRGRVVHDAGFDADLPAPFGSLLALFFEPVPADASTEWSSQAELWIADETPPLRPGLRPDYFGPSFPGRPGMRLAVTRTIRGRWEHRADAAASWVKTVELASLLTTGDTPRLQASGEGTVVFDRPQGRLRTVTFRALSVVTTPTLTQRRPMTLEVRLLEGEELEHELERLTPQTEECPPVIAGDELTRLLADLEVPDDTLRLTAINRLRVAAVETPTPDLLAAAVRLAQSADYSARAAGAGLLGRYGTAEQVPAMLKLLQWSQSGEQGVVLERLHHLKDPRTIEPLADLMARSSVGTHAVPALLKRFGSTAEPAVLALLNQRHAETRRQACEILGEIGTVKSVAPLREQMIDPDPQVSQAAATALRAVSQRLADPQ